MAKFYTRLGTSIVVSFTFIFLAYAAPTIFPTGTTIYKPDEAFSSYILISDHTTLGNHPEADMRAQGRLPDDVRL